MAIIYIIRRWKMTRKLKGQNQHLYFVKIKSVIKYLKK